VIRIKRATILILCVMAASCISGCISEDLTPPTQDQIDTWCNAPANAEEAEGVPECQ
jgi:hypothetical protein